MKGDFHMTDIAPRYGSINQAVQTFGVGRSSLYVLASKHPALIKKFGKKSLVDYGVLQDIINDLPTGVAKIRIRNAKSRKLAWREATIDKWLSSKTGARHG
jgi:predicted DNA-binding transcriptional regulator AlpA